MQPAINAAIVEPALQYRCVHQDGGQGSVYRAEVPLQKLWYAIMRTGQDLLLALVSLETGEEDFIFSKVLCVKFGLISSSLASSERGRVTERVLQSEVWALCCRRRVYSNSPNITDFIFEGTMMLAGSKADGNDAKKCYDLSHDSHKNCLNDEGSLIIWWLYNYSSAMPSAHISLRPGLLSFSCFGMF